MAQSLSNILLHLVFSTKNREKLISKEIMPKLYAYIAGICKNNNSHPYLVGGTENHVHVACSLPRTLAVSKLMEEVKKSSSLWMKRQENGNKKFEWQSGYGAFSLGKSQLDVLLKYIENQHEHHKYQIEYDTRYVLD